MDVDVLLDVEMSKEAMGMNPKSGKKNCIELLVLICFDRFSRHLGLGPTSKRNG